MPGSRGGEVRKSIAWLARSLILGVLFAFFLLMAYGVAESRAPKPIQLNRSDSLFAMAVVGFSLGWAWKSLAFRLAIAKARALVKIGQIALILAFAFALFYGLDALGQAWIGCPNLATNPLLFGAASGHLWRLLQREKKRGPSAAMVSTGTCR
ncbi:MAG TPA: hypothetical protein VMI31_13910 [Fimbriimonadaceae bacterium]|nr:hypothetical protein [Fimbriimonadaceae bacterium]